MREHLEIPLTQGLTAKVDWFDYEWLMQHKWNASWAAGLHGFYARRVIERKCKRMVIRMHRDIVGLMPYDDRHVDHINRDPLDNRRSNLRIVTPSQNMMNRSLFMNNTSGTTGVASHGSKWQAYITVDKKRMHLGSFRERDAAIEARRVAEEEHFGNYARIN